MLSYVFLRMDQLKPGTVRRIIRRSYENGGPYGFIAPDNGGDDIYFKACWQVDWDAFEKEDEPVLCLARSGDPRLPQEGEKVMFGRYNRRFYFGLVHEMEWQRQQIRTSRPRYRVLHRPRVCGRLSKKHVELLQGSAEHLRHHGGQWRYRDHLRWEEKLPDGSWRQCSRPW